MTLDPERLGEALAWSDEMALDILNGPASSASAGVELFRVIEDAARSYLRILEAGVEWDAPHGIRLDFEDDIASLPPGRYLICIVEDTQ